ncbi:MAG TPA: ATP-binding protein [Gemmatimonadaceae bacterium]|nr:ATP-binding protein [Gemmatimonadaceae bacterium]
MGAHLSYAFKNAPSFFAILKGPDLVFEAVNDAYYHIAGRRDLIGKSVFDALPELRADGLDKTLARVVESGVPHIAREVRMLLQRTPYGPPEERVLDFTYLPLLNVDDSAGGIIVHGHDVTDHVRARTALESARDRAERLYRFTTRLSLAPTLVEVADATIEGCREAFPESVGTIIARRASDDGQSVEILAVSDLPGRIFENWQRFPVASHAPLAESVREGKQITLESPDEWESRYPDLVVLLTETGHRAQIITPLVAAGDSVGAIGIAFDADHKFTDEEKQYAASLGQQCAVAMERARLFELEKEARTAAEKASAFKSEFLAGLSHELRTPLNAIGGYAELIAMGIHGTVSAAQKTALDRIQASKTHLQGLIDGVLELTRIEAGAVHYTIEPVSLAEILATCEALTAPQMEAKNLNYRRTDSVEGIIVLADGEKVRQILLNLLTNAVKYTADGGEIDLDVRNADGRVLLSVSDTGRGIASDKIEAIFEPFVQIHQTSAAQSGVGLGLAISRNLARGMLGELSAVSTLGNGSCFTLVLPQA